MALLMFSRLIGIPLLDTRQERVATLKDVVVRIDPALGKSEDSYPPLAGLVARAVNREVWIPANQVASFEAHRLSLASTSVNLERFVRRDGEILLGQDVLDKQLVDIEGRRVVRVNDLALGQVPGETVIRLLAVDISLRALSRRIFAFGGEQPQQRERLLDWKDVQYFASNAPAVRLDVSHNRLEQLHPADLARVLDDLSHQQRDEVMIALSNEAVAATLEMMTSNEAADILEEISDERASDILEEMRPDVAADVVAEMDEDKAETLLNLMEHDESDDVRELLSYPKDTAGGIMTNEFVIVAAELGAAETLRSIREQEDQPEFIDYLYICDPTTQRLQGVVSLRDVVFYPDRQVLLEQIMEQDIISVNPTTAARDASALLTEYGLRALPVVEETGEMVGVITFDDALEVLLPQDLRERVERIFTYRRGRFARRQNGRVQVQRGREEGGQ